jgi:hypothetical protein
MFKNWRENETGTINFKISNTTVEPHFHCRKRVNPQNEECLLETFIIVHSCNCTLLLVFEHFSIVDFEFMNQNVDMWHS